MQPSEYPLDYNGALIVRFNPSPDESRVHASLATDYTGGDIVKNTLPLISFERNGKRMPRVEDGFDIPLPPAGTPLILNINNIPCADFALRDGKVTLTSHPRILSVYETRIMGRSPQNTVPCLLEDLDGRIPHISTDLHTHLSGQVQAKDLIAIGLRHHVLYPTAALDMLGIAYPEDKRVSIPKRIFLPLKHLLSAAEPTESAVPLESLSPTALASLQRSLSYSPNTQHPFEDMEKCYYLREPFTKDIRLLPDILQTLASDYQKQGIHYAELSSNAVLDPQWLKTIHDVMPEIERKTHTQLRFLAGMPRNLDDDALDARFAQFKRIAKSPYIAGMDFLGYEMNKTSHLSNTLEKIAAWMHDEQPSLVLRVHAGENSKNPDNVKEALQLAEKHGIRMRIGHAVHGIDGRTLVLARKLGEKGKLIVEFCPDSNLACNNIDHAHEIPILTFLHCGIPSVLASDGAGQYMTDAHQTVMAGLFSGVTPQGFNLINRTEHKYITEQQRIFTQKQRDLPADFFAQLNKPPAKQTAAIKPVPVPVIFNLPTLDALPNRKHPIFIAGAAGSNWDALTAQEKNAVVANITLLLEHADPDKVFFVTGRTKECGIGIALGKAVAHYNNTHAKHYACVLMLAEGNNGTARAPEGITHMHPLNEPLAYLPGTVMNFIKTREGLAYFAGGGAFTRDFILAATKKDIPFGLVGDVQGAAQDKAAIYPDHRIRADAGGMVAHAMQARPDFFRASVSRETIAAQFRARMHEQQTQAIAK